jgi:hypothetical protein
MRRCDVSEASFGEAFDRIEPIFRGAGASRRAPWFAPSD